MGWSGHPNGAIFISLIPESEKMKKNIAALQSKYKRSYDLQILPLAAPSKPAAIPTTPVPAPNSSTDFP